jgi:hypothetical protein
MGKKRGRKRKAKSNADYQHLRRNGFWPRGATAADQLKVVIRDKGTLSPHHCRLAARLPRLCTTPYQSGIALKDSGATAFEVLDTPGEPILREIARKLTGMHPYAPTPSDRSWLLFTRGVCKKHYDCKEKGVFTLVVCLKTDEPYRMAISHRRDYLEGDTMKPEHCREVTLDQNEYLVFPSCMWHKCIAEESNARVIVNTLLKL